MDIEKQRTLVMMLSVLYGLVGLMAMAICAVFSLSSDLTNVVGAGLGLITGAVLMGAALISMAVTASR